MSMVKIVVVLFLFLNLVIWVHDLILYRYIIVVSSTMESELLATVERLQSAVILVMDPQTPPHVRREASDVSDK